MLLEDLGGLAKGAWGEQSPEEQLRFLQRRGVWQDEINCLGEEVKDRLGSHRLAEQTKASSGALMVLMVGGRVVKSPHPPQRLSLHQQGGTPQACVRPAHPRPRDDVQKQPTLCTKCLQTEEDESPREF